MRVDAGTQADLDVEVASSSFGDRLEVNAWYGGELVAEHLDVLGWSIGWDATRLVQGQSSWTFADPEGTLAPWALDDALAPGGAQLQVTWVSGSTGLEVPVGWYRIRSADPRETWRLVSYAPVPEDPSAYGAGAYGSGTYGVVSTSIPPVTKWVPGGGGQVTITADDLTCIPAELDRLDAEPVVASTSIAEAVRLLEGVIAVSVDAAVDDSPIPASLVYEDGRMDAVEDHLTRCHAVHRMGPAADLEVLPEAGGDPVWTIAGGDEGVLISTARTMSDEGLYNAATSTAESIAGSDAAPLVGRAYLDSGALRWGPGTPFGRRVIFHQSPANTQSGVDADAATLLANRQVTGEVELTVECLTHPGLQLFDVVTLVAPSTAGEFPIEGRVTSMKISGGAVIAKRMVLGVAVTAEVMAVFASRVRGHG